MKRYVRVREAETPPAAGRWVEDREIAEAAYQGVAVLKDDPDPVLNADLRLNGHTIIGELEKETLVIDGGLI
jgi:hypothetical protein